MKNECPRQDSSSLTRLLDGKQGHYKTDPQSIILLNDNAGGRSRDSRYRKGASSMHLSPIPEKNGVIREHKEQLATGCRCRWGEGSQSLSLPPKLPIRKANNVLIARKLSERQQVRHPHLVTGMFKHGSFPKTA